MRLDQLTNKPMTLAEVEAARRGQTIDKACQECGRPISYRPPSRESVFCSRKCAAIRHGREDKQKRPACRSCGKRVPHPQQKACSWACAAELKRTAPTRTCPVCRRSYRPSGRIRLKYCSRRCYNVVRSADAFESFNCDHCQKSCQRRKIRSRPREHRFCSRTCRERFYIGEHHTHWRGGSDPNRGAKWLKIAAAIRERDGHICRRCGKTEADNGRRLDVDHIRPWRSFEHESEANDPSNLVSLCGRCHKSKTSGAERAWLRGDRLAMLAYERSVTLPSAVTA